MNQAKGLLLSMILVAHMPILAAATTASADVVQLNTEIQAQLKQMQAQYEQQMLTLNTQIQNQIKQLQADQQAALKSLNTQLQAQIQQVEKTLQANIQQLEAQAIKPTKS